MSTWEGGHGHGDMTQEMPLAVALRRLAMLCWLCLQDDGAATTTCVFEKVFSSFPKLVLTWKKEILGIFGGI